MSVRQDLLHLTWRGRLSMALYAVRRLFVEPAPAEDRCFMGAPIGEHVHCPRPATTDEFWCARHAREYGSEAQP